MLAPLDRPIVCPITIGREPHLQALEKLLDQLVDGGGQTLLVTGEAGIGKSRLIAEAKRRAAQRGALVLQGQCFETDRSLPYAPFIDLLRTFGGVSVPDDLADLLPDLAEGPSPPSAAALDPEQQKRRLFRALNRLVGELTQAHPVLMVVEDVHWADETSLELLRALARTATQRRLLLVLTYRSDEVDNALRGFLTSLDRERLSVELRLQRLSPAELEAMVRAIFEQARPGRTEFLDLLYGLTEGNPFFVEEVLRALVGAGDIFMQDGAWSRKPIGELRVPRSVEDAVQRRTAQLSAAARDVVALAAVAGRRFDFELLATLSGHDESALVAIVRELIVAGLVIEESADQLAFRHALTRQAIYTGLLARERRSLHRRVAETLQRLGRGRLDEAVADLAYHYAEAGLEEQAQLYARRAGERALRMYAPHAALEHFARALDAARQLGSAADPELLRLRGRAYDLVGTFDSAEADYSASVQAARASGDRHTEWRALLDLSLLWAGRDYQRTGTYATDALELAQAIGDQRLIAETLNRVGNWHANREEPGEALRYHQQALDLFDQLGDVRGRAETLDLLGMASSRDPVTSAGYYAQAIPMLRTLDDRPRLVTSLIMRALANGSVLYDTVPVPDGLVSLEEAQSAMDEALRVARDMEWPAGESFVAWETALWLGPKGAYAQALPRAREGLAIALRIDHRQWQAGAHLGLGALYLDICAYAEAEQALTTGLELAREVDSRTFVSLATGALASTHVGQGKLKEAAAVLEAVLDPDTPMTTGGQRLCWVGLAELRLASGEPSPALEIVDRLIETSSAGVSARVWHLRGDTLVVLGRPVEALDVLHEALAAAQTLGARSRAWRIQASLARVLRSLGRRDEGERVIDAARHTLRDLALEIDDPSLRDTFVRATSAIVPAAVATTPARAEKQRYGGLTRREREIAVLVARGLSNRAMAEHLVLGERTIESHVANVMSKLGFASRTQIAAWAVQHGLDQADARG